MELGQEAAPSGQETAPLAPAEPKQRGDAFDRYLDATEKGPPITPTEDEESEIQDTDLPSDKEGKEDDANAKKEEDKSPESEAGRFIADDGKVRLEDGTVTTVAQLKRGNLREADYTRKLQALSEQAQVVHTRDAALTQQQQTIDLAISILEYVLPEPPDPSLIQTDMIKYLQENEAHKMAVAQLQQLQAAKAQQTEAQQRQQTQNFEVWAARERELAVEAMPEFKDPVKVREYNSKLVNAIAKYGFTPADANGIFDHRFLKMGKDLIEYQELLAAKPVVMGKVQGKPPLAPTARTSAAASKDGDRRADFKRLRESGGKDAAAWDRLVDNLL